MTIQSFSKDEVICAHGIRALEWILRAGQGDVVTVMMDDGVIGLCSGLLLSHHNLDVTRYVCGCLTKLYKYSSVTYSRDFYHSLYLCCSETIDERACTGECEECYETVQTE